MAGNLKTVQLITFVLENFIFGIDIMLAQEILKYSELKRVPNVSYSFPGILNLRNEILPIINLKYLFNFNHFNLSKEQSILVLQVENKRFGIIIDKILKLVEISKNSNIQSFPEGFPIELKNYITNVLLNEKELIAILDISKIYNNLSRDLSLIKKLNFFDSKTQGIKILKESEQNEINQFIKDINFKLNKVTSLGINNFFIKKILTTNLLLKELISHEKKLLKSSNFSPFRLTKRKRFFDNYYDFSVLSDLFEQVIIPKKITNDIYEIKIVHLGCGSGEQLYSIVLLLMSLIKNEYKWKFNFIGIDENYENISFGKKAKYSSENLINLNEKDISMYFSYDKNKKKYSLNKNLVNKVEFRFGKTKNINAMKNTDLIFCRDVFVQLTNDEIHNLCKAISNSLNFSGILFLSQIEDLPNPNLYKLEMLRHNARYFYSKKSEYKYENRIH